MRLGLKIKDSSPIVPPETKKSYNLLKVIRFFGRHDWTRTNDPYHVKVVL